VPLDFNGFADLNVVLGPAAGQLTIQGSVPLPDQLDFDWNPIVFGGGVPVGGYSHVTVRKDGTYTFSGHFHDSGGLEYNMALVWAIRTPKTTYTHFNIPVMYQVHSNPARVTMIGIMMARMMLLLKIGQVSSQQTADPPKLVPTAIW
jgi:hypothetical protein